MSVFDGELYRVRARFEEDQDLSPVTIYTADPARYFAALDGHGIAPSAATVHRLSYVVSDTEFSFGEYVGED